MRIPIVISALLFSLFSYSQVEITAIDLSPEQYNVLRYDFDFATNEPTYAYINYYKIIFDSLGNEMGTDLKHSALHGPESNHHFKIMELTQETEYFFQIFAYDTNGCAESQELSFTTGSLPSSVPQMDSLYVAEGAELDGYYLTNTVLVPEASLQIFNRQGEVVWYNLHSLQPDLGTLGNCKMYGITDDDNLLLLECHQLTQINLEGDIIAQVNFENTPADSLFFHHDAIINDAGNFVVIAAGTKTYPSGDTTITVIEESLLEFDQQGNIVWEWRSLDWFNPYDAVPSNGFFTPIFGVNAINWMHCNAVTQDTDGHYILSFKEWSQILKINSTTGEVMWTLGGGNADIQFQFGEPFGDQHEVHRTPVGTYILFDNTGLGNLSRIMEFSIDTYDIPTAINEWEWVIPEEGFSNILGSAARLPNNNRTCLSGNKGSIWEVNSNGELLWHLRQSSWAYRSYFIDQLFDNSLDDITLGDNPTLACIDEPTITLNAEPQGGCWSGTGVTAGTFDPQEAGLGLHTLVYKWGWKELSLDIEVSDAVPPCAVNITELNQNSGFEIFPNPSSGSVFISLNVRETQNATVRIYNAVGQLVLSKNTVVLTGLNKIEILETSLLDPGLYQITLSYGPSQWSKGLIIE